MQPLLVRKLEATALKTIALAGCTLRANDQETSASEEFRCGGRGRRMVIVSGGIVRIR